VLRQGGTQHRSARSWHITAYFPTEYLLACWSLLRSLLSFRTRHAALRHGI